MWISEKKMQIVINNYFKQECDINTSIRGAFEKGFRIGVKKGQSAQPERKKGKWDFIGWQMFQCSECKHTFTQEFLEGWSEYTYESLFPPFCPNCGSYNGGEQDGSNHTGN